MKKIIMLMLILSSCNGRHLAWVPATEKVVVPTLEQKKINTNIAGIELSFDDGPSLVGTPKILEILKKYNLHATFFVEGINLVGDSEQAKERRLLLKQVMLEGHSIGNHSFSHKNLCLLSMQKASWEIDKTSELIKSATGLADVKYIRPPYGKKCSMLNKIIAERNMAAIYWDIDPREWERDLKTHQFKTSEQVVDSIMNQYNLLHNQQGIKKMIIILHDTKQITPVVLSKLIPILLKEEDKK